MGTPEVDKSIDLKNNEKVIIGDVEVVFSDLGLDLLVGETRIWLNKKGAKELVKLIETENTGNMKDEIFLDVKDVLEDVERELDTAMSNWPPFNSAHEGWGVLSEEVCELWEHVKTKQKNRDLEAMRRECIQVAAMAVRFALEICNEERGRK